MLGSSAWASDAAGALSETGSSVMSGCKLWVTWMAHASATAASMHKHAPSQHVIRRQPLWPGQAHAGPAAVKACRPFESHARLLAFAAAACPAQPELQTVCEQLWQMWTRPNQAMLTGHALLNPAQQYLAASSWGNPQSLKAKPHNAVQGPLKQCAHTRGAHLLCHVLRLADDAGLLSTARL